jgi:hypothetical protein
MGLSFVGAVADTPNVVRVRAARGWCSIVLLASLLVGFAPAAMASSPSVPDVRIGERASAVTIRTQAWTKLGRLPLPAGRWVVMATFSLRNTTSFVAAGRCTLRYGGRTHRIEISPIGLNAPRTETLVTAGAGDSASPALLRCINDEPWTQDALEATSVRIVALRAGRLQLRNLDAGTGTSTGNRRHGVRAIVGSYLGPGDAGGFNNLSTITTMSLPAGEWLLLGVASVENRVANLRTARCLMRTSRDDDESQAMLNDTGSLGSVATLPFAMGFRAGSPSQLSLACAVNGSSGDVRVTRARLLGIRTGKLTTRVLGGDGSFTHGTSGAGPRTIVGTREGPVGLPASTFRQVGRMKLAAGPWLGFGKGWLRSVSETGIASCQTRVGGSTAVGNVSMTGASPQREAPVAGLAADTQVIAGPMTLRCRGTGIDDGIEARSLVLAALRAGKVVTRSL